MALLEYNHIREGVHIVLDGEPYEVVSSHVARKQQRKPVNQTKIKHLVTGRVTERTFQSSDKAEAADISKKPIKFLYFKPGNGGRSDEYWFSAENDPSDRFTLPHDMVAHPLKFIKQNGTVDALTFNDDIVGLKLPVKVELKVKEAEPAVKGNTATGATKTVTLETGIKITTPLFINEGDILKINTDTGDYIERVKE